MRPITVKNDCTIHLGKQGENLATQIQFPVVDYYRETFGEGTFQLLVRRETDDHPYAVPLTLSGNNVCWNVENTDVAIEGNGSCELQYYVDERIAKSITWRTKVYKSMGEAGEAPEIWWSWIESVLAAGSQAQESASEAKESELNAKESEENALASAESASESEENARIYAGNASASASSAYTSEQNSAENAQNALEAMISSEASEQLASASASSASSSATLAGEARVGAETAKSLAEGYASSASSSAGQAQGYANSASGSASVASEKASQASASATQASTSASQASSSASSASASATSASESATTANTKASEASASATSAQASATQASASADSASASASSASASATQALLVKTELENTVQSVHNLEGITADMVEESQVDFEDLSIATVPSTFNGATLRFNEVLGETRKTFNLWNEEWEQGTFSITTGEKIPNADRIRSKDKITVSAGSRIYCKSPSDCVVFMYDKTETFIGYLAAGNRIILLSDTCAFINFYCGSSATPVTEYANNICINLSQPDTTVSPHNGEYEPHFDGLKSVLSTGLKFNGANLFDISKLQNGTPFENGFILQPTSSKIYEDDFRPHTAYTLYARVKQVYAGSSISNVRLRVTYTDGTYENLVLFNSQAEYVAKTFTTDASKTIERINGVYGTRYDGAYAIFNDFMIVEGSVAPSTYTPYNPNASTSLTYPQVELKRVNELRDKLRLVRSGATWDLERVEDVGKLDLGTLDYNRSSGASSPSGYIFRTTPVITKPRTVRGSAMNILCGIYNTDNADWFSGDVDNNYMVVTTTGQIWIRNDTYDNDIPAFKAAMSGVILYYELAEPIVTKILTGLSTAQVQALFEHNSTFQLIGNTNDAFVKPDASIMVQSRIDLTMSDADLAEILAVFD